MVPPLVTASRWAPGRPVSWPVTRSQTRRGPQLGELVARVAPGEHVEGRVVGAARERGERRGAADQVEELVDRPGVHRDHRDDLLGQHVERVGRVRAATRSARRASARRRPRSGRGRRGAWGTARRGLTAPTWWPARPTRCRPLATLGGDSTWMTRSTAPMSMPSSRLLVATTQGSRPRFRSSSIRARCSLETEPWWALASTGASGSSTELLETPDCAISWAGGGPSSSTPTPARSAAISLSRAVSRSASRRELAKTIVERCGSIRSTTWSSTCGQIEVASRASPAAARSESSYGAGAVMSSTGTTTLRSHCLADGGATISTGRVPPRKRATSSTGRTVADSPMRWAGCVEQRVEPLEAEREVGAALGAGDGVHLVDDHRLDAGAAPRAPGWSASGTATRAW